jgi:hypothetical protein
MAEKKKIEKGKDFREKEENEEEVDENTKLSEGQRMKGEKCQKKLERWGIKKKAGSV